MTPYARLSWVGSMLLCLPLIALFVLPGNPRVFTLAGAPALVCILYAHILWWVPKLRRVWPKWGRTVLVPLTLTLAAPVSVGIARHVASAATGLPPGAVDLTVIALSLLTYPVLWGAMLGCMLILIALISTAASMLLVPLAQFIAVFGRTLYHPIDSFSGLFEFMPELLRNLWYLSRGTIVALAAIVVLAYCYGTVIYDTRLIRNFAYFLDFGIASKYPGLSRSGPMRLLENGYVAYANRAGIDVTFEVVHEFK